MSVKRARTWIVMTALVFLLGVTGSARALPPADAPASQSPAALAPPVVSPLLQYQGRLTDPGTGDPKPDGPYEMTFRLWTDETTGTALWAETKDVNVTGGLFSTALGDTTALNALIFSGQALWLGIQVAPDPEATPRQQILPVAYAFSLVPGAVIESSSGPALWLRNPTGGAALAVEGDLEVADQLIGGRHTHNDADIASTIARDSEIMPIVLGNDGPGSTLDADYLDGYTSSSFAFSSHTHPGLLLKTTVLTLICATQDPVVDVYTKILDVGPFGKTDAASSIEITYNGRIGAWAFEGGATGATFELRVDNAPTTNGWARANIRTPEAGGDGVPVSMTGVFTGLGAGEHVVSIWAIVWYGTGRYVGVDPNCFYSDHVVVKEYK
jgi:hypothetical protein